MKRGRIFIITGLLLIVAALCLTGYNIWDSYRAGRASDSVLEQLKPMIAEYADADPEKTAESSQQDPASSPTEAETGGANGPDVPGAQEPNGDAGESSAAEIEYPDYVLNPEMDMPEKKVENASYIGLIELPSVDRELPVYAEWNYSRLKKAPCRYSGTAYLNNMVICAHNYVIHFGPLKYLSYGDPVIFTDMDGNIFRYQVTEIETLQPDAIEEMTIGDWDLTLFTCTLGGATRVTVRCDRVSD